MVATAPAGDVAQTGETTRLWVEPGGQPTVAQSLVCETGAIQSGTRLLQLWLVSLRPHRLESRMREICLSGSEGGVALSRHPYPIQGHRARRLRDVIRMNLPPEWLSALTHEGLV